MNCSNAVKIVLSSGAVTSRFRDAEINHLRHRHSVVQRDQDIRRLDVAVDDALLMRVLDRVADLDEQAQPLACGELVLVAVLGDPDPAHQLP